jgi:UDPglucose 6-dehydrogenase
MNRISLVGLGKLGSCIASSLAVKGYKVIGIDVNRNIIDSINDGKAPFIEPKLQAYIAKSKKNLKVIQNYDEAIENSDITILVTPTPSEPDGHFSDKYLRAALKPLAKSLKRQNKKNHLFSITSTVSPGTVYKSLIPFIEKYSGKKLNRGFNICYNPVFIALGSIIDDFLKPNVVLIGESNKQAGDKLVKIYKDICKNRPYFARMSIISAEITKLSVNAYVTMKISFANALANICGAIPDSDVDSITKVLGSDRRISPYYLKGGPAFGGPCFPRDNRAFVAFAKRCGCEAKLAEATDRVNNFQVKYLKKLVLKHLSHVKEKSISILGLAYKRGTPVIEESSAVKLIDELLKEKTKITVYDPLAMSNAKALFGNKITYAASTRECICHSPLWIVMLPLKEFKKINENCITKKPTVIIDCWRILDKTKLGNRVNYVPLGKFQI